MKVENVIETRADPLRPRCALVIEEAGKTADAKRCYTFICL
jgi:hypothetical protein